MPTLICFGEILWDILPSGKIAGGAPMNVAFHANQLGLASKMISRVGDDPLGSELLDFLNQKGVSTQFVQLDTQFPTGAVNVTLDQHGSASYVFVQPAAWDFIAVTDTLHDAVMEADALVYGSLACRDAYTKKSLLDLLKVATLRIFDVNLRRPFYSKELLQELLDNADIVKMNDDELAIIAEWEGASGDEMTLLQFLREKYQLDLIVLTKGANGAACLDETGYYTHPGFQVQVQDTIGSGDAFLAAFLSRFLKGEKSPECLEFAGVLGALVATKQGGTPSIAEADIQNFIHSKKIIYV